VAAPHKTVDSNLFLRGFKIDGTLSWKSFCARQAMLMHIRPCATLLSTMGRPRLSCPHSTAHTIILKTAQSHEHPDSGQLVENQAILKPCGAGPASHRARLPSSNGQGSRLGQAADSDPRPAPVQSASPDHETGVQVQLQVVKWVTAICEALRCRSKAISLYPDDRVASYQHAKYQPTDALPPIRLMTGPRPVDTHGISST
jgi:hypothetical protein